MGSRSEAVCWRAVFGAVLTLSRPLRLAACAAPGTLLYSRWLGLGSRRDMLSVDSVNGRRFL